MKSYFKKYRSGTLTNKILLSYNRPRIYRQGKCLALDNNKHRTRFQLDTASDITLISQKTRKNIGRPTVHLTTQLEHSASDGKLNIVREVPYIVLKVLWQRIQQYIQHPTY